MTADIHIDDFYRDAAIALLRLYNSFPRPMAVYIDEITRVDEPDEFGVISERQQRCMGALLWLADEKIIRFKETIGVEGIEQAVLTLPALQAMHANTGDQITENYIQAIRQALREKSSMDLQVAMHGLLTVIQRRG